MTRSTKRPTRPSASDEGAAPGRRRAREAALQMLYQWDVGSTSPEEVEATYWLIEPPGASPWTDAERDFARALFAGTVRAVAEVDPLIGAAAEHWRLDRMAALDRLILRMAVYELAHELGTPRAVVINEAIELARSFGGDDSARFVNGVIDAIRRRLDESGRA